MSWQDHYSATNGSDESGRVPGGARHGADPGAAGNSWRILIVEDNWLISIELEIALSQAGFEVVGIATNMTDAVRLCEMMQPEVVLMDIRLAGGDDGIDAAIEIRQRYSIPSILMTAHGDPATRERARQAEPLGWIVKPIASIDLVRRLKEIRRDAE